jgi:transcription initiation factor TFIIB
MLQKINSKITMQTKCNACDGNIIFDSNTDEKICIRCGIVSSFMQERDHKPHLVKSIDDSVFAEQHTNHMMYAVSLPSFIGEKNVDATGKQINKFYNDRMRKLNKRTISSDPKIRNLNKAIREIRRITDILGMKTLIAERASYIYKKAYDQGLIRGRSISGIAAAAIYVACKELDIPYSVEDIKNILENVSKKNVLRYYKILLKQINHDVSLQNPMMYLSRISKQARLSGKTERKAYDILSKVGTDSLLVGKKPISIAAAALYLASLQTKECTTQLRIAIASDLTTITIRKRSAEMISILEKSKPQIISGLIKTSSSIETPVVIKQTIGLH